MDCKKCDTLDNKEKKKDKENQKNFHTFLYEYQRTVYIRKPKVGSGGRVTLGGGSLALKIA